MESSEDDAGNATSASRRASAREKDIGQAEDVEATSSSRHEPPETTASCETAAMSEDNFDGDSVPSPSAQDVNTSTEAILDMIDEIVDGPGAPKRLPFSVDADDLLSKVNKPKSRSETEPIPRSSDTVQQPWTPSPPLVYQSVLTHSTPVTHEEYIPQSEVSTCATTSSNVNSQQTTSVSVDKTETSSNQHTENITSVICVEPELAVVQSVSDSPSSSAVQPVQNISNVSECEQSQRTVKCVTSSDNLESVTVERAESTSSECSVSESKELPVEPLSRSPLRRRLVRPVPCDRRPDSTVSSTVDSSQTLNVDTTQQTISDVVVKDVSSSSDAVPHQYGNVKPDAISNVSEISICKAETSTAPKKIRLVRPKTTLASSNVSVKIPDVSTLLQELCQSTSDEQAACSSVVSATDSRVNIATSQAHDTNSISLNSITENVTVKAQEICAISESADGNLNNDNQNALSLVDVNLSSKVHSQELKSCDIQSAQSNVQLHVEQISIQPDTLTPTKEFELSNILPELKTSDQHPELVESTRIKLKSAEPMEIPSEDLCFSNTQSRKIDTGSLSATLEPTKIQSKDMEPCEDQSQETEPSDAQSTNLELTEVLNKLKPQPMQIQLSESIEPNQCETQSEDIKPIEAQSSNLELTEVSTKLKPQPPESIDSHRRVLVKIDSNEVQTKLLEHTDCLTTHDRQSNDVQSIEVETALISSEEPAKVIKLESTGDHSRTLESTKRQSEVLEPLGYQPKVSEATESIPKEVKEVESKTSKVKSVVINETVTQPQKLESAETKSKDQEPRTFELVKLESSSIGHKSNTTNESKAIEPIEIETKELETEQPPNEIAQSSVQSKPLESTDAVQEENETLETKLHSPGEEKKLPPIKLTLTKVSKAEIKTNEVRTYNKNIKNVNALDSSCQALSIETETTVNSEAANKTDFTSIDHIQMDQKKVPPIKLSLSCSDHSSVQSQSSPKKTNAVEEKSDSSKQVPKLTIKLGNKQAEEMKSPIPKLTIKPIRPPTCQNPEGSFESSQQIPNVTKLNIKPIVKPQEVNDSAADANLNDVNRKEHILNITKLNIKPIPRPAEKINDVHRTSSSSEMSESEYSENDETTSTSDQASASEQGPCDSIPKVTIKLGKPGTESEGKFYTEKNIPKLTIKGIQQNENDDKDSKLKVVISQSEDVTSLEKVPKLTIKGVTKSEGQPVSPKLSIKPIKQQSENENEIPKLKISTDANIPSSDIKENMHVPKITIKAVTKPDFDTSSKTPKKATLLCESSEASIPVVTKLNIKPILKPMEGGECSDDLVDKVPVVSKLNIKPVVKPKDNEVDSSVEDVPKIIKLNIKPIKSPEDSSSEGKDCDETLVGMEDKSIPVITKLNIKPIVKPKEDERLKDSEIQSSETGTSSDDNSDHIPVVTKLNIKPIVKPSEIEEYSKPAPNEKCIPVVTKLNIKPLVKPEENILPSSPKRESLKSPGSSGITAVTKLNIKPIVKPEESEDTFNVETADKFTKNPPIVMKINIKNVCDNALDQKHNNYVEGIKSPRQPMSPKMKKSSLTPDSDGSKHITSANVESKQNVDPNLDSPKLVSAASCYGSVAADKTSSSERVDSTCSNVKSLDAKQVPDKTASNQNEMQVNEVHECNAALVNTSPLSPGLEKQKRSLQNCTLLKQLLSNTKDDSEKSREMSISNCITFSEKLNAPLTNCNATTNVKSHGDEIRKHNSDQSFECSRKIFLSGEANDLSHSSKSLNSRSIQDVRKEANESVTKPLEIITEKLCNQSSGQDSPRIILKINKTDHGSSAKIITEECQKATDSSPHIYVANTHETVQEKLSPKKYVNSRKKLASDETVSLTIGKRLRSSKLVETPEKPVVRRNAAKRSSVSETSPTSNKECEMSLLDSKRLKLEQLLTGNKGLTITPVASKITQTSPSKPQTESKQSDKPRNHSLLKNDNCSKNGNSKLHNILTNLQAKQMQSLQLNESAILSKDPIVIPDVESNISTGSSDVVVEISRIENCHPTVQEMIINEHSEFRDLSTPEEMSQDPLEVDAFKTSTEESSVPAVIKAIEVTPTPRKRGRPRKFPVSEGGKPAKPSTPPALPVPALEERPQRSLRLLREKPAILSKPRGGRGRGRGGRRAASPVLAPSPRCEEEPTETVIIIETVEEHAHPPAPEDPTSSRIKLPRMTEALDKSSSACMTPVSSKRDSTEVKFSEPTATDGIKSPEASATPTRGRGSRGGRWTPRGRTPRAGRGRGRGGGRGATYMKETMGIYGRVCGPATTTVELFEEETCMMDDNATPSKPSHLLDEDSQSSVKSSTNDSSNKMKKSKFADLFDSNKVWTAFDVKEYMWPPPDVPNVNHQVMMIQEQVAMFLGVKSFKRRYAELKRRAIVGDEKDYVLKKDIVTEALCDLGITAVDASDVLDIMLSDYPHKYEEYRSHQRQRQLTAPSEHVEIKTEEKPVKVETKSEKTSDKPEPPKVDPEKTRQDMAAAAIASAAEWNAMANAWRRPACVDLQSNTIHRRRAPPSAAPPTRVRPPGGFYPLALLPGQYQHAYRVYTPAQLRYFPLNTVIAAPPAAASPAHSSDESDGSWGDHSSSSEESRPAHPTHHAAKRKKLTKTKRSSEHDKEREECRGGGAPEEAVELCRACKLRLEANRKYTHERFLVCAHCNAKLHPSCTELNADTVRKCREYPWQCAECKTCYTCSQPADDDKMLFCDLCDRGAHIYCVGLTQVPTGRWHCVECALCKSCGARDPNGLPMAAGAPGTPGPSGAGEWHHQTRRGPGGHKVYSHSLCTPCARMR